MVDRITPVTTPENISLLKDEYGVEDGWPVVAEPFLQWVVEDTFARGRPRWELAPAGKNESVIFVADVEPYELMKLRLLNSSHSAMAYVSLLSSHVFVDEALGDIDVLTFLRAYMNEVVQTLVPVAGVDFIAYRAQLVERFSNPYIKDTLERLAQDGSQKFFATLGHALVCHFKGKKRSAFDVLALAFAAFLRCCAADPDEADAERCARFDRAMVPPLPPFEIIEPKLGVLAPLAAEALDGVVDEYLASQDMDVEAADESAARGEKATNAFLAAVFGKDVEDFGALTQAVYAHFQNLAFQGTKKTLSSYRTEQLLKIKAEIAQTYTLLRELQRQEILLTPPEDAGETTVAFTS
jgi:mannitol-1-phosphate/altronate dehydrogenase